MSKAASSEYFRGAGGQPPAPPALNLKPLYGLASFFSSPVGLEMKSHSSSFAMADFFQSRQEWTQRRKSVADLESFQFPKSAPLL